MSAVLFAIFFVSIFLVLLVVHELGHYFFARRAGVKVQEFGIGIPPRAWSKKLKNGVLFSLNWLPLGAFVKVKSTKFELLEKEEADPKHDLPKEMVEESLEDAQENKGDLDGKTFSQRVLFFSGGIIFNLLLAGFIYFIASFIGRPFLNSNLDATGEVLLIQSVNDSQTDLLKEYPVFKIEKQEILSLLDVKQCDLGNVFNYRCEEFLEIVNNSSQDTLVFVKQDNTDRFVSFLESSEIDFTESIEKTPVEKSDLPDQANLISYTVGGEEYKFNSPADYQTMTKDFAQQEVILEYEFKDEIKTTTIVPNIADSGSTGAMIGVLDRARSFNPFRNALMAANQVYGGFETIVVGVGSMIGGLFVDPQESASQVKSIVGAYPEIQTIVEQNGFEFGILNILPLLSILLAVMNLLPIPALDGGHIAFAIFEKLSGKTVQPKTYIKINTAGFIFLMGLGLVLIFRDIGDMAGL
jgi:regulator of sigma E protease